MCSSDLLYRRDYIAEFPAQSGTFSHLDCFSGKGVGNVGCDGGSDGTAGSTDFHELCHILSHWSKAFPGRGRASSVVYDIYGAFGAVRGLFFLHGGKFYDCQKQAGQSGFGKYCDSVCDFTFASSDEKITRGTKSACALVSAGGSGGSHRMSVQYFGSAAHLYGGGGCRIVGGGML